MSGDRSRSRCLSSTLVAVGLARLLGGCATDGSDTGAGLGNPAAPAPRTSSPTATTTNPSPSERASNGPDLTKFAASADAWLAAHDQAPGYAEGAAFLPAVDRESSELPMYAGVSLETPVVSYSINLPDGTSLEEAQRVVLGEFPTGAKFGTVDDDEDVCLIASIRSPVVQRTMREAGWGNWVPAAVFGTSTADRSDLDLANVTDVTLVPVEPADDLGTC